MLKYLAKISMDIFPSVLATIIGAYIVNHYINAKPAADTPAAVVAPAQAGSDGKPTDTANPPAPGVKAKGVSEKSVTDKAAAEKPADKSGTKTADTKAADTKAADTKAADVAPAVDGARRRGAVLRPRGPARDAVARVRSLAGGGARRGPRGRRRGPATLRGDCRGGELLSASAVHA